MKNLKSLFLNTRFEIRYLEMKAWKISDPSFHDEREIRNYMNSQWQSQDLPYERCSNCIPNWGFTQSCIFTYISLHYFMWESQRNFRVNPATSHHISMETELSAKRWEKSVHNYSTFKPSQQVQFSRVPHTPRRGGQHISCCFTFRLTRVRTTLVGRALSSRVRNAFSANN